ncbi:hypothetical protein EIG48_20060 [Escherichia coli]|nr:hypothetical protein [Escherichia coli]
MVTVVPVGSSQSSRVGNKAAEAFDEKAVGASVSIQVVTRVNLSRPRKNQLGGRPIRNSQKTR